MIVHEAEPYNAETTRADLAAHALTPAAVFYVRNHGPVPEPGARVRIGGLVREDLAVTVAELRERFAVREVVATLQCAGNRRAGLIAVRDIPGEAPWGPGATGTATWGGVRLGDVLCAAGVADGAAHVAFVGADISGEADPPQRYGSSVPLDKAGRPEVLLAFAMNGDPLPAAHGAPLRVVVPGYIGARSVKWLERIELREDPWDGFFQSTAYRMLPADGEVAPGAGFALGLVALNSDVLIPEDGATVAAGPVELLGYAFAGGERHVARVDVSVDGGGDWRQAELLEDLGRWAWRQWRLTVDLPSGDHDLHVRAWDSSAATQPEDPAGLWNPKGYCNNAQARIRVHAR